MAHSKSVHGSNVGSDLFVWRLHVYPVCMGFPGRSRFLPQFEDIFVTSVDEYELITCVAVNGFEFLCQPCDRLATNPGCPSPLAP